MQVSALQTHTAENLKMFAERISVRQWESRAAFLEPITNNATACTVSRDCEGEYILLTLSEQLLQDVRLAQDNFRTSNRSLQLQ